MNKRDFAGIGDGILNENTSTYQVLKRHHGDSDNCQVRQVPQIASSVDAAKLRESLTLDVLFNDVLLDWGPLPSSFAPAAMERESQIEDRSFQINDVASSEEIEMRLMRIWVLERPSLRVLNVSLGELADERYGVSNLS